MKPNMDRREQLLNLQNYMKEVDKDITMILQNLQWDYNLLQKGRNLSTCKYNEEHKMPSSKLNEHEEMCFLKCNDYSVEDTLLPELLDKNSPTVVTFNSAAVKEILDNTAKIDPLFKRGHKSVAVEPLSVERLQATYTSDERRAIHNAVISSVQSDHDSEDFVMPSGGSSVRPDEGKSRLEQLAELRDRRRRRTKYRAPPKTRNYSVVLRDVISAQMEMLNEVRENLESDEKYLTPKTKDIEKVNYIKRESSDCCNRYENVDSSINIKNDKYNTHRSRHTKYDKDSEYKNTGRYDRSRSDNARNSEKERNERERSTSRDPNKYRSKRSSHRDRDKYSSGSHDRKKQKCEEKYEEVRHRYMRDTEKRGYSEKDEVYKRKKDCKYE